MTVGKLDINTRNNDIGLYFGKSRRVVVDTNFGEMASWIKAGTAGNVIWKNTITGETNLWNLEAGETFPCCCDIILSTATIDGTPETTTSTGMMWASTPSTVATNE